MIEPIEDYTSYLSAVGPQVNSMFRTKSQKTRPRCRPGSDLTCQGHGLVFVAAVTAQELEHR